MTLLCPDHLTRHDMSIEESIGEAGYQYCFQWLFFFVVVSHAAREGKVLLLGPDRTFFSDSLRFITITSISSISLSTGQFKVFRSARTSYSTYLCFPSPSSRPRQKSEPKPIDSKSLQDHIRPIILHIMKKRTPPDEWSSDILSSSIFLQGVDQEILACG